MKPYCVSLVMVKHESEKDDEMILAGELCEAASREEAFGMIALRALFQKDLIGYNLTKKVLIIEVPVQMPRENVLHEEAEPPKVETIFPVQVTAKMVAPKDDITYPEPEPELREEHPHEGKNGVDLSKRRGRPSKNPQPEQAAKKPFVPVKREDEGPRKYLTTSQIRAVKNGTLLELPGVQAQAKKFVVAGAYVQGRLEEARIQYRGYLRREIDENIEDILTWESWIARKFSQSQK